MAANEKYAELMQHPLSSIIGESMDGINPQAHIDNVERDFRTFDAGGRVPDHEIVLGDESLLVSVNPFFGTIDQAAFAISVTLQNITEQKKAEARLVAMHQELLSAKNHIEALAYTDTLTNLSNRRGFDAALQREICISRRHSSPLALVMADVDCFKQFNDIYGHLAGDECLAQMADVFRRGVQRAGDFCARYGGEEFVIILPHTEIRGAVQLIDRLRRNVQKIGIPHTGHAPGVVTASFGIAGTALVPHSMDSDTAGRLLLQQADAALYRAKANGKNRVIGTSLRLNDFVTT